MYMKLICVCVAGKGGGGRDNLSLKRGFDHDESTCKQIHLWFVSIQITLTHSGKSFFDSLPFSSEELCDFCTHFLNFILRKHNHNASCFLIFRESSLQVY